MIKLFVCVVVAYVGFYAPILYVSNRATKRKQSIQTAWPDALDLMLICVESGMSVEAAFRKVAEEIGAQSVALAEELMLTNAELSYPAGAPAGLRESRRAHRPGIGQVGRPGADPGRTLRHAGRARAARAGQESRDMRMNEAEKKAAALPPKLTVPMILFFLPVLFAVILGPAGIQVSERGIFGSASRRADRRGRPDRARCFERSDASRCSLRARRSALATGQSRR